MGDWTTENGTEIGVSLDQAREKAKDSVSGSIVEDKQGFTTTFTEFATGRVIGQHYER